MKRFACAVQITADWTSIEQIERPSGSDNHKFVD